MAMIKVPCEVVKDTVEGEFGELEGVRATCSRCRHAVECAGTTERSVRRALATLRDECPRGERNFYYNDDEGETWSE